MKLIIGSLVILAVFHSSVCKDAAPSKDSGKDDRLGKLAVLNRLFNSNATDHLFTADDLEVSISQDAGYVQDAVLGKIPLRFQDLPDCNFLLPIHKLSQPVSTNHILIVGNSAVDDYIQKNANWKYVGVIGYGTQNKNECGATRQVRHFTNDVGDPNSQSSIHILISDDSEANDAPKKLNVKRSKVPAFYIWDA